MFFYFVLDSWFKISKLLCKWRLQVWMFRWTYPVYICLFQCVLSFVSLWLRLVFSSFLVHFILLFCIISCYVYQIWKMREIYIWLLFTLDSWLQIFMLLWRSILVMAVLTFFVAIETLIMVNWKDSYKNNCEIVCLSYNLI